MEDSRIKGEEVLVGNFETNSKRYQDSVFWALSFFVSHKRNQFQNSTFIDSFIILNSDKDDCFKCLLLGKSIIKYLLSYFFSDRYLIGTAKAPVDVLRLNTLIGTKIAFLTP